MPTPQIAKPAKPGAIGEHHVEVRHRHRLGFRDAVNVDELRQHVADAIASQMRLRGFDVVEAQRRRQLRHTVSVSERGCVHGDPLRLVQK